MPMHLALDNDCIQIGIVASSCGKEEKKEQSSNQNMLNIQWAG